MFEDLLINYWAVLASAMLGVVIGAFWYSPLLFGKTWVKLSRLSEQELEGAKKGGGMIKSYLGTFLTCLVTSLALGFFLDRVGAYDVAEGLIVAGVLWLGFIVTIYFSAVLWERKPFSLFLINAGYYSVFLSEAAAIQMLFQ